MTPTTTSIGYSHAWSLFTDWCAAAEQASSPASPVTVPEFLDENPGSDAVQLRRVSAINRAHRDADHPLPGRMTSLRLALDSIRAERIRHRGLRLRSVAMALPAAGSTEALYGRRDSGPVREAKARSSSLAVLSEIKNRGVIVVCIVVCDGLKGLPEAINTFWELAVVQTCIIHLIRSTFRFVSRKYWAEMARDLRSVYTSPSESAAKERFTEFAGKWGGQYPAIVKMWDNAWSENAAVPGP